MITRYHRFWYRCFSAISCVGAMGMVELLAGSDGGAGASAFGGGGGGSATANGASTGAEWGAAFQSSFFASDGSSASSAWRQQQPNAIAVITFVATMTPAAIAQCHHSGSDAQAGADDRSHASAGKGEGGRARGEHSHGTRTSSAAASSRRARRRPARRRWRARRRDSLIGARLVDFSTLDHSLIWLPCAIPVIRSTAESRPRLIKVT